MPRAEFGGEPDGVVNEGMGIAPGGLQVAQEAVEDGVRLNLGSNLLKLRIPLTFDDGGCSELKINKRLELAGVKRDDEPDQGEKHGRGANGVGFQLEPGRLPGGEEGVVEGNAA